MIKETEQRTRLTSNILEVVLVVKVLHHYLFHLFECSMALASRGGCENNVWQMWVSCNSGGCEDNVWRMGVSCSSGGCETTVWQMWVSCSRAGCKTNLWLGFVTMKGQPVVVVATGGIAFEFFATLTQNSQGLTVFCLFYVEFHLSKSLHFLSPFICIATAVNIGTV